MSREIGHYRILSSLGAGAMGEVYLAEDRILRRRVALKVLPPSLASNARAVARFQREARSAASLNHPNIVTVYSVEEADGLHFLTMELVEGQTLTELIPETGMPLARSIEIGVALCRALAAAHAQGLVHRDLKPDNVMVTEDGRIKVLDFGIAKVVLEAEETLADADAPSLDEPASELTEPGKVLGTAPYMSPEQVAGKGTDARSDLFSLGVVLHQLATGRRPFHGATAGELLASILRDPPPPASTLVRGLPQRFDAIVARCLAKSPAERYGRAELVLADLEALARTTGSTTISSLLSVLPKPWSPDWSWRSRAVAGTVTVALVAAVVLLARGLGGPADGAAAGSVQPSLAVLPLENLSGDPEYFVDGMTDALISALGNLRGVRVISRQSVMRYKGSDKPMPKIARELGVGMVLEGSVVRSEGRVRVTAQLVQAEPEQQLWSESYERDLRDILELQSELAADIARSIELELGEQVKARLASDRPVDPAAFEACLRGRYFWNKRTNEGFRQAIVHFNQAIALDPSYAPAYAGLADTYCLLGFHFVDADDAFSRAEAAARQALALDSSLAEAHTSLGGVQLFYRWNWSAAERELDHALKLNPSYATARLWKWAMLAALDRREEAAESIRLARELDPLSLVINNSYGLDLLYKGRPLRAIAEIDKTIALDAKFGPGYFNRWLANSSLGRERAAMADHVAALRHLGYDEAAAAAERTYRRDGYRAALVASAEKLAEISQRKFVSSYHVANIYEFAGETDRALEWLNKAYAERSPGLIWARVSPAHRVLYQDPRYHDLLRRVGLVQGQGGGR